ncbi:hypothetical protein DFS33DRAFT_1297508 [Desarmillaria ectypa]|nr:hypothetical protein DFS33DRAFT_1297508 [Desarmillaria ectypa]
MVPYIEPSADPVLQVRLLAYPDAARHCLRANYNQPLYQATNFRCATFGMPR